MHNIKIHAEYYFHVKANNWQMVYIKILYLFSEKICHVSSEFRHPNVQYEKGIISFQYII